MPVELKKEIDLPVTTASLLPIRDFFNRCLRDGEIEEKVARDVLAALDSALAAAVLRGQEERRQGYIAVVVDINATRLRVVLRDDSDGAELRENAADGARKAATRARQDAHLSLLRRVMDEVHYNYRRGFQNELEVIKFL